MEMMLTLMTVLISISIFIYWWLTRTFNYWKKRGVFYIQPEFFFGNIKDRFLLKTSYHEFQKDIYFKMKGHPYAGLFEGTVPNLMVLEPELIRQVLVKDFDHYTDRMKSTFGGTMYSKKMLVLLNGKEWKNIRAIMTPTFSSGKIKGMLSLIMTCAEQLISSLRSELENNEGISTNEMDTKDTLGKFTLDVIASCAFGVQCDSFKAPDAPFAKEMSKFGDIAIWKRLTFLIAIICKLPDFINRRLSISFMNQKTIEFLADVVKDTTKLRETNNERRNDFLQLLMDARSTSGDTIEGNSEKNEPEGNSEKNKPEGNSEKNKPEGNSEKNKPEGNSEKNEPQGKKIREVEGMNEEVMIGQCILFFVAGYDTSSTLLSMTCYELAKNKDVQDKLREEIKEVLAKYDNQVTYEALLDMPYLEMVLSEVLRMYPPVARLDRQCTKEHKLGNLTIEEGMKINIPVMGLHYDPEYFLDPDKFLPERFSSEAKLKISPYVYMPFGLGPRNCLGQRFAKVSVKLCMVYIFREFSVNLCSKTQIPFNYHRRPVLLKAKDGVWLQFSKSN